MAFNAEKLERINEEKFKGEWKHCRRCDCDVLIRPQTHPDFLKLVRALEHQERRRLGLTGRKADQPLPDESAQKVFAESIARTLLVDWREVVDQEGNAIPFDSDRALSYMLAPKLIDFRLDVIDLVNAASEDDLAERELIEGN